MFQVTGAGHGIGREIALKYASLGSTVVCVDINEEGATQTVKEIQSLGAAKAAAYKSVTFTILIRNEGGAANKEVVKQTQNLFSGATCRTETRSSP